MDTAWIVILVCFLCNKVSGQLCSQNFTQASVIETPRFPDPYPANSTCEWTWSRPTGRWAVSFEVFDINCRDTLYLKDLSADKQLPFDCSQKHNDVPVYYTKGSDLLLKFHAKRWNSNKPGFKIRILYGNDIDELKKQVYNHKIEKSVQNADMYSYYPWLMPMMLLLLIVIGVGIFIIKRRKPSRSHTVSVDLVVNNKPKNSIVFKRTPSASSEEDTTTTKVEVSRGSVKRSTSIMSWTMRATLSSTSSSNNGGVVDNLYMPMNNDIVNYQNQINKPLPTSRPFIPFEKPISKSNRYPVNIISGQEYPV